MVSVHVFFGKYWKIKTFTWKEMTIPIIALFQKHLKFINFTKSEICKSKKTGNSEYDTIFLKSVWDSWISQYLKTYIFLD